METEEGRQKIQTATKLKSVADEQSCTMAQLAIAWCLLNPNVSTVILGASRAEQLEENLAAADLVEKLTPEVVDSIETILGNRPTLPEQF
jgi:aryl-alcohol dehydrogenase-like predicted oxidoreductase